MAQHGTDIAAGMSPEACTKRVHIFSIAAQYVLNQEEIDSIVCDSELESYLITFGWAQKALTIFSLGKNTRSVFQMFFHKRSCAQQETEESKGIADEAWMRARPFWIGNIVTCHVIS